MSRILLDLKNFKHEKSDEKSTTLSHKKDGHTITLAHKALDPKTQEALKAMVPKEPIKLAAGGDVPPIEESLKFDPNVIPEVDPNAEYQKTLAEMKSKTPFPGETISDKDAESMALDQLEHEKNVVQNREKAKLDLEKASHEKEVADKLAQGAALEKENERKIALGIEPEASSQTTRDAVAAKYFTNDQSASQPNGEQLPAGTEVGQAVSGTGQVPQGSPEFGNPEGMLKSGYENQLQGINQTAQAQGDLGKQQADLLNKQAATEQNAKIAYQQNYDALEKERQAHILDIKNSYINPDKYWTGYTLPNGDKVSGHSKVMAGIGMILAGFNPTGRPNAAVDFLKDQMDRNLQAQAKNLQSGDSLLAHNLQQFGNMRDAADMTRLMQADVTQNYLQSAAATAQSPLAKAAALQAAGKLQQDFAPLAQQFAMRRAMMDLANDPNKDQGTVDHLLGYMRVMNPEMAKEMESRYVPGSGLASIPIPQEARTEMIGKQNFDQMAKHYVDWVKKNANSLNPATIKQGATMAAELQGAYRQSTKGGTYKEGEQEFIEKLIPSNPAQFVSSIRTLPKLEALVQSNQSQLNQLKKGYGLPVKVEPQYKIVNGIKYMRGPKGEAIPVK